LPLALAGLVALAAAMGVGRFVYTPILPFMEGALGLTKPESGLIASANFIGYLLGALAAAKALLPGSRRGWFLWGLAGSAATTAAMGLADGVVWFVLLRFAGGLASAFVLVFSSSLILDRLALAGRPQLSALHFAGVGLGIAFSALLVAWLAGQGVSWRGLWTVSGLFAFAALLLCWRTVPRAPEAPPASAPAGAKPKRSLVALATAYGFFGFGYIITATFLSVMVHDQPGLRGSEYLLWFTVGIAAAPSAAIWIAVGRRLGNGRAFAVACLAEAVGVALSVLTSELALLFLAAALLGATFVGITALGLIHARSLSTGDPRRSVALMTAAFGLGQIIGPLYAGELYRLTGGFTASSLTASALLVAAAALVLIVRERG
jgi:predicted MFS family arabinose efflux permease